jgi:PAS domain S-box-containing protein
MFVWLSHAIGVVLGTPFVLLASSTALHGELRRRDPRTVEAVVTLLATVGLALAVFLRPGGRAEDLRPLTLGIIPLLIWVTIRGPVGIGPLGAFLVLAVAALGTTSRLGPYASAGPITSLIVVQNLAGAAGLAILLLHAIEARRRVAERAIHAREAQLQRVLAATNDGMWEWRAATDAVVYSARVAEMIGRSPTADTGLIGAELADLHPDDRDHLRAAMARHLEGRTQAFEAEVRVRHADGSWRWVLNRGRVAERDRSGRPVVVSGTVTDISARKRAEEELRAHEERRLQTQKLESLGLMAGGIAHDFNNLLTGVIGHTDLARGQLPPGHPVREHLDRAMDGARGAAELTQQMLAYAGRSRTERRPVDLAQLVAQMGHLLQVSVSRRSSIRYAFAPALASVEGDPAQLRQVVMNLILNAGEAVGEGGGALVLSLSEASHTSAELVSPWVAEPLPAGRYVTLEVRDDGVGMDEATLQRIFDPFFSTKFTGRGLGLAAVLGIVRAHGGTIQVESAPGEGTTFRVRLPAAGAVPEPVPAAAPAQWRLRGRVLVVDDDTGVRELACALLRRLGAEPVAAASGAEALERFRTRAGGVTLALVDATMPGMSGVATLAALRAIQPALPVVLMSGWSELPAGHAEQARPDAFLAKPFDLGRLTDALRAALEARGATSPPPAVAP